MTAISRSKMGPLFPEIQDSHGHRRHRDRYEAAATDCRSGNLGGAGKLCWQGRLIPGASGTEYPPLEGSHVGGDMLGNARLRFACPPGGDHVI